ncbi:hypothetical protein NUBL17188_28400 [Klebsiella pneumoniae]|nr:hypothetical protein NUBL17188_28400 [Klebsiella pneumoniae]
MLRLNAVHLAVCLLPLALAGCGEPADHDDPRIRPPLVRVATVERAEAGSRAFTGVVVARPKATSASGWREKCLNGGWKPGRASSAVSCCCAWIRLI